MSNWTEGCFCKQIFASVCLHTKFLLWWGGKCCGLWSITGDHQLRHMAWAWCSRRLAAQPAKQFYREIETWVSTLYCVICRHLQFLHGYVHQYPERAGLQNLYIWHMGSLNRPSIKIAGVGMEEHDTKCSSMESAAYWSSSAKCSGPCAATLYNMIIPEFFKHHSRRCWWLWQWITIQNVKTASHWKYLTPDTNNDIMTMCKVNKLQYFNPRCTLGRGKPIDY